MSGETVEKITSGLWCELSTAYNDQIRKLADSIRSYKYFEVALERGSEVMVDRMTALTFRIYEVTPL